MDWDYFTESQGELLVPQYLLELLSKLLQVFRTFREDQAGGLQMWWLRFLSDGRREPQISVCLTGEY